MYRQLCGHTGADPEAGIDEIQLLDMYKALGLRVDDDFETLCELGQGVMVVADREVAMALAAYQRIPVTPPPVPSPAWWPCLRSPLKNWVRWQGLAELGDGALRQLVAELDLIDYAPVRVCPVRPL